VVDLALGRWPFLAFGPSSIYRFYGNRCGFRTGAVFGIHSPYLAAWDL
jgi:hypothetical protein